MLETFNAYRQLTYLASTDTKLSIAKYLQVHVHKYLNIILNIPNSVLCVTTIVKLKHLIWPQFGKWGYGSLIA